MGRLIIDGNKVFEIDEECMRQKGMTITAEQEKNQDNQQMYPVKSSSKINHTDSRKDILKRNN